MTQKNNETHPFWSGFAAGTLSGAVIMYILGTKKGRETLQNILNNSNFMEKGFTEVLAFLEEVYQETRNTQSSSDHDSKSVQQEFLETVMDKVKDISNSVKSSDKT